ncbi:MAG: type II CRISPR RNA-guided endonuclease Cas9 [Bacteroidales bacterium]|nr:type II CRISPR RNA-guided endonuclease Cas9 [Bacteroidales bacterium]
MKKKVGLDIGTNSIGWAVVDYEVNQEGNETLIGISQAGSRIIPMDAAQLGNFDKGNTISQTAERTRLRGVRRLLERQHLRRERLNRVLDTLGFLPEHYAKSLDRYGKIQKNEEPKIAWKRTETGKSEFIFMNSFNEMLTEFRERYTELLNGDLKIPHDWTLYYLRKKALTSLISNEELAWVLHSFNQKRGYYQLRGEEAEESKKEIFEYLSQVVISVEADFNSQKGKDTWYNVILENGMVYRRQSKQPLDWVGKTKEFIVTTKLNPDGTPKTDKDGNIQRSFKFANKDNDWALLKVKTEKDIDLCGKTVGTYIYDAILDSPDCKIRGALVRTIDRKYYKDELRKILTKQCELNPELNNRQKYAECISALYPSNDAYRKSIETKDFIYLLVDDVIFYQRPLKSKKNLIANCPYEKHQGVNPLTGEVMDYNVKCIAKSNPLFEEFRLWQFIHNLKFFERETDNEVTSQFLNTEEDIAKLFGRLNGDEMISQKSVFKYLGFNKVQSQKYRWNYVEDKEYPCAKTRATIIKRMAKAGVSNNNISEDLINRLWQILYSIEDKEELRRALKSFAVKNALPESIVEAFEKCKPFDKEYGSYSAKAIGKLLPLMRVGKYWSEDDIDSVTKARLQTIIDGELLFKEVDFQDCKAISDFRGLPLWKACYAVYGSHSEARDARKWDSPEDIDIYLKNFKQHSLHNPIVEQVIMETLRVVRDIWKKEGRIDEIHVELGREMKNPADKRRQITENVLKNEITNLRIKALLTEFANPEYEIENVRPYSPSQQDLLRIYEDGVLNSSSDLPEDITAILNKFRESDPAKKPSSSDIKRYKLWLEQKYQSPYTGEFIPLGKLFTPAYEIEHIIPQSRYFDDSMSNKVICEAEVNKLKSNLLGYEFIKQHHGEKVTLAFGKTVTVFTEEQYKAFVVDHYSNNRGKSKKLMLEDIPDDFINRQLNDTRYISKLVKGLLSNIVREESEDEATSKNVITCNGDITTRLKIDWGLNDVWNSIILPRFMRLNEITGKTCYTTLSQSGHLIPEMPLEQQKGFVKKRIDHRHHAMDAIVIACASKNIVNYLNNSSASSTARTTRYDLQKLLCDKVTTDAWGNYEWRLKKPWDSFTTDAQSVLENIIVSFKKNTRVITKTVNMYQKIVLGRKVIVKQSKGDNWAIRKPLHKDTVFADVNLRKIKTCRLSEAIVNPIRIVNKDLRERIDIMLQEGYSEKQMRQYFSENKDVWQDVNINKIECYYYAHEMEIERYYATRKVINESFSKKKILEEVTDTGIQKILLHHLEAEGGNPSVAFSPDGIDRMNQNLVELNGGKKHQPIFKVRVYEQANKFSVGHTGNKTAKFVEAAKGTNLFFAIYETQIEDKVTGEIMTKRSYDTIPLNIVVERMKQGLNPIPENEILGQLLYCLSPNDLVYVPTREQLASGAPITKEDVDRNRIYKMVSATGAQCLFLKFEVANIILNKVEYQALNKMERAITGEMIKDVCIQIEVDRLGNIIDIK